MFIGRKRIGSAVAEMVNDLSWRRSEVAAIGGFTNARSLARLYALLAMGGELDGVRLVSEPVVERFRRQVFEGTDSIWSLPGRHALGYFLSLDGQYGFGLGPCRASFGYTGLGGATAFADPQRRISFAFVPSALMMTPQADPRAQRLVDALYAAVSALERVQARRG